MSTRPTDDAPALVRFSRAVNDALDKASGAEPLFLSAAQKTEALCLLETAEQRIRALKLKLLGAARLGDDVCEPGGHRDVADLMSQRTGQDRAKWAREHKLAQALERRWVVTREACLSGEISIEHARVIVKVLDDLGELPEVHAEYLDPETLARAEAHLIELATEHNPTALRKLAAHLFEVIAPEAAEEIEAKKLAAMEQRAEAAMRVTIRRDAGGIDGLSEIRLRVPDAIADRFTTYLQAFTNPQAPDSLGLDTSSPDGSPGSTTSGACSHDGSPGSTNAGVCSHDGSPGSTNAGPRSPGSTTGRGSDGEKIPQSRRLAMAFAQLLETLDPHRLPIHGGDATHVVVTIGLEQLRSDLAAADLGFGEEAGRITAAQARRLACTAHLIPAVLGADSEILDLGRSQRLFSRAQRRAMALRDQCCRAEGCAIPATWCEAHHFGRPWAAGGRTDLADGVLLCSWHHHRAHDDRYLHQQLPNGDIRYSRRT